MRSALLFCLLFAASALGAPPEVQTTIKAKPGQMIRITLKGADEIGSARNFTDEEAFFGELVAPKGQRQFVFQAPDLPEDEAALAKYKTTYVVSWWTKGETEGIITTITITGAPTPGPAPNVEPEGTVDADLLKALQDGFTKDGGAPLPKLAATMKDASAKAKSASSADAFVADVHKSTNDAIGATLTNTRAAIGAYLNAQLPTDPGHTYTPAERTKVSTAYGKVATALAKVK